MDSIFKTNKISYENIQSRIKVNLSEIKEGITQFDNFFTLKVSNEIKFFDRICDHQGGKLILKSNNIICPFHNWQFDPLTESYTNVGVKKRPFKIIDLNKTFDNSIYVDSKIPKLIEFDKDLETNIEFINHACIIIHLGKIKLATDPWIIGSSFSNGWWLKYSSPKNAIENINSCDYIYISHNHPDHLHPETLSKIDKEIKILTPNYSSNSTVKYLKYLNFKNIKEIDFSNSYTNSEKNLSITPLKSGDFRDDSGLLIQHGNFSALFNVDCNYINFYKLPKNISALFSSFAGGASGFPLCFENYDEKIKNKIIHNNKAIVKNNIKNLFEATTPKYFFPYAGYFVEAAKRDLYIKERNIKNEIADYKNLCKKFNINLISPIDFPKVKFVGSQLIKKDFSPLKINIFNDSDIKLKNNLNMNKKKLIRYFQYSHFHRNFNLIISLTNENFSKFNYNFVVNFQSNEKPNLKFLKLSELDNLIKNYNQFLYIKFRKTEFLNVIYNSLPWEDLVIGFQCRILRKPNIYNSEFWYHFTNIYVNEMNKYSSIKCDSCKIISHNLNNLSS